jgi:hypothetical protein
MRLREFGYGFGSGALLAAVLSVWLCHDRAPGVALPGAPAPALRGEATVRHDCKPLVVYRDRVKRELGLPAEVEKDPARQVAAATVVPASDRPHTVSAVANLETGQVSMFVRPDPLPWLERRTVYELGLAYGFKDDAGEAVARASGRADLLQVKALRLGLIGSVDSDGDWFGGVGVTARWQ